MGTRPHYDIDSPNAEIIGTIRIRIDEFKRSILNKYAGNLFSNESMARDAGDIAADIIKCGVADEMRDELASMQGMWASFMESAAQSPE